METDPRKTVTGSQKADEAPRMTNSTRSFRFPPGFIFNPTDDELIVHYLNRKIKGQPLPYDVFNDARLYDYHPAKLFEMFNHPGEDKIYIFTPRLRKYPNGNRPARTAAGGQWKATGSEKKIFHKERQVGVKKTLVYYEGKPKTADNEKTEWTMQEYISKLENSSIPEPDGSKKLNDCVLCSIQKKRGAAHNPNEPPKVSQARSNLPTRQTANDNQSYQTSMDWNAGYGDSIMVQPLAALPLSEPSTSFNGMVQPFAAAPSGQMIDFTGMVQPLAREPSMQIIDFNGMVQPAAMPHGEPMANVNCAAQTTTISPIAPNMADCAGMAQPFAAAPTTPMADFTGMAQPFGAAPMADFDGMAQLFGEEPMANFNGMAQPFAAAPMANFINGMAQPFAAAPTTPMIGFDHMTQPFAMESHMPAILPDGMPLPPDTVLEGSIIDYDATRQPPPCGPLTELNEILNMYNNHLTGQQQNSSNDQNFIDQFGTTCDARNEVVYPGPIDRSIEPPSRMHDCQPETGIHPSMEQPSWMHDYPPETGIDDLLSDAVQPEELHTDKDMRYVTK